MEQNSTGFDCDVLVVGAGPTGLTLATALAARGVSVVVIDRLEEGANTSRAAVVHARTLETLEQISVAERLKSVGIRCGAFSVRDRDRSLMTLDFTGLPTRYPYTLMVSQAVTEAVLVERLGELGVTVTRPRTLESFTQDEAGVDVVFTDGSRLRTRYLAGADGMHSKVRELAGIDFEGDRYGQSFVLADVRLSGGIPRDEVILYFSPQGMVVAAPLPGGTHRIVAAIDDAPESPDVNDIQNLLNNRGPVRDPAVVDQLIWSSRFRVHHRVASRYRAGRVLLAGDAAHVHSPAGGQGMNTGIQDGMALAGFLVTALHTGDPVVLDQYTAERRPIAQAVISLADRLTRLATVSRRLTPLRNLLVSLLGRSRRFRTNLALRLAGLAAHSKTERLRAAEPALRRR
jgi:2-polyprenyl-6-methoxyphenol hydroxylase-like FAD-dependent oxidoreductase